MGHQFIHLSPPRVLFYVVLSCAELILTSQNQYSLQRCAPFKAINPTPAPCSTKVPPSASLLLLSVAHLPESRRVFRGTLISLIQDLLPVLKFCRLFCIILLNCQTRDVLCIIYAGHSVKYINLRITMKNMFYFRYIKRFCSSRSKVWYFGYVACFLLITLH